ncbi:MAG TPA: phytanoyl-CoA dioxygenase family protein [Planctomycetota bacterium]|nr:phytanoyl-CoA dioxygenase family protein [Planctomycetota bacterium]
MPIISDEQWWQYHQQGYLRLGKLVNDEELEGLRRRIDDIMLGKVPFDGYMQLDRGGEYSNLHEGGKFSGATLEYRKIQDLERDPLYLSYMQKPIFREICDYHYGAHANISVFRAMFMNKPARKGTILPWHQDGGTGWDLDRDPLATLWLALDPATVANGCVEIIPGSHKLGLLSERGHTISKEHEAQYCTPGKSVFLELKPGECVLMHNLLLHRSGVNNTDIPRRGFSVCYMDARTTELKTGKKFPVIFGKGALKPEMFEAATAQA